MECQLQRLRPQANGITSFFPLNPFLCISNASCTLASPPSTVCISGLGTYVLSARAVASHSLNSHAPNSFASVLILNANVFEISTSSGFSAPSGNGSVSANFPPPPPSRPSTAAACPGLAPSEMASKAYWMRSLFCCAAETMFWITAGSL